MCGGQWSLEKEALVKMGICHKILKSEEAEGEETG